MDVIKFVHQEISRKADFADFKPGDNIVVSYKIIEGNKERLQDFRGGSTKTFTVRKISNGVGVERIFPFHSPNISEVKVLKRGRVRRARLYYLRDLVGKKARIREKQDTSGNSEE
jgi:large subunit ribosomal protein L19